MLRNITISKYFKEQNIGVINSFFSLLDIMPLRKFISLLFVIRMLIWKPEKVERAVQQIKSAKDHIIKPILYCSDTPFLMKKNQSQIDYT
jgi:hypothetical protein